MYISEATQENLKHYTDHNAVDSCAGCKAAFEYLLDMSYDRMVRKQNSDLAETFHDSKVIELIKEDNKAFMERSNLYPAVPLLARLRNMGLDATMLTSNTQVSVTYIWDKGAESVEIKYAGGGGSSYRGTYHPNGVCESRDNKNFSTDSDGNGVCDYCGKVY